MFLTTLNDNKKDAFLALAANVVPPCDRGLYQSVLWREWLAEMQFPERTRIGWDDVTLAVSQFDLRQDKASVMLELARLAADAVGEPESLATFARIGGLLGFTTSEVDAFFDWALRHAAIVAEAKRIGEECA